jgi:hypothetical protein
VIAGEAHFRTVKLVEPQPSWVRILDRFKIRACNPFGHLAQSSQSPRAHVVGAWPRLATVVLWADFAGYRPHGGPG